MNSRRGDIVMLSQVGDPPPRASRRSFILLAVLVCMMSAILVATALLFVSQTEAAGAAGSADAAQARALAWSGMQAVINRLAEQRDRILAGEMPELDPQYVIYETPVRAGVVRLLPIGPEGGLLMPEAAKLDVNRIDAETLARTGLVDLVEAEGIIAWRDGLGRPVQSTSELLSTPGMTVQTLYGSVNSLLSIDARREMEARPARSGLAEAAARGLADVVTVFSVEPAVQYTAARRINLNQKWSDELGRRIEERFGTEAAAVMKQVFESGVKFENDAGLVKAMRSYNTPLEQWPALLDAFTTESGELHFGRLDINRAPREALLALPGLTPEQVDQMVGLRSELSPVERGTIAWPVTNQIIPPEVFEPLASRLTTRSWTYRIRLAAGEVSAEAPEGSLSNPVVFELVIDLAGPKPRIGYLRDITMLRDAALLAMAAPPSEQPTFADQTESAESSAAGRANTPSLPQRPAAAGRERGPARPGRGGQPQSAPDDSPGSQRIGRWRRGQ